MLELYYWTTPNGHKVTLFLEEAGLDYTIRPVDIGAGEQFAPAFLEISPNNKIPALVDHAPADGGAPVSVFESGAILLYLAEKTGCFLPVDRRARIIALEWLFWQMAGLGPMTGQYGHFNVYAPQRVDYAIERYTAEAQRLLGVLEHRLRGRRFIVGDDYTIADMACFPWINPYSAAPLEMTPYPEIRRWHETVAARPATRRAYALTQQINPGAGKPLSDTEREHLFGRR